MSLEGELRHLFGRDILTRARQVSLETLCNEAEAVAEGARQLRLAQGNVQAQRAIVEGMAEDQALALCRWIQDSDLQPRTEL